MGNYSGFFHMQNLNTVSISVDQIQKLPIIRKISGIFLVNWHKKGCLFFIICFLGCRLRIRSPFLAVCIGKPIFYRFIIENDNEGPMGNRGFEGGGAWKILIIGPKMAEIGNVLAAIPRHPWGCRSGALRLWFIYCVPFSKRPIIRGVRLG